MLSAGCKNYDEMTASELVQYIERGLAEPGTTLGTIVKTLRHANGQEVNYLTVQNRIRNAEEGNVIEYRKGGQLVRTPKQ